MNKIITLIVVCCISSFLQAQDNSFRYNVTLHSQSMAKTMAGSLELNAKQEDALYQINMNLHEQKATARKKIPDHDKLARTIQQIENRRDSLYRQVISPDKFVQYKARKENYVRNN
jgi:hypothetical protein